MTYYAARAAVVTLFIGKTHAGIGLRDCQHIESRILKYGWTDCNAIFDIAQAVGEEEGP